MTFDVSHLIVAGIVGLIFTSYRFLAADFLNQRQNKLTELYKAHADLSDKVSKCLTAVNAKELITDKLDGATNELARASAELTRMTHDFHRHSETLAELRARISIIERELNRNAKDHNK